MEFLMLVDLQKDSEQWLDATKLNCTHYAGQTASITDICGIWLLLSIFLETNKHQNLARNWWPS